MHPLASKEALDADDGTVPRLEQVNVGNEGDETFHPCFVAA